jgi:CheY-like chemotaxis protein
MTRKILVVEDEPASLRVLQHFWSYEGYETARQEMVLRLFNFWHKADSILCYQTSRCLQWTV